MTSIWYPVTPIHPSPIVKVWGLLDGGKKLVSRGAKPNVHLWATWERERCHPLPPGVTPSVWQPQHPDRWKAPLPDPVAPFVTPMPATDVIAESPQWWRDINTIRYEDIGSISQRMAEGRVMRAVAACGEGIASHHVRTFSSMLAEFASEHHGSDYPVNDYAPRLRQTRDDIADFDVAMAWFAALNPPDLRNGSAEAWSFNRSQKVLVLRSLGHPWSFGKIADKWGLTPDGARKLYVRSIEAIWRVANGMPAYSWVSTVDQIEALRERNRMARGAA